MVDQDIENDWWKAAYELHCATFAQVPGAQTLTELYGYVPNFHDAIIQTIHLSTETPSILRIANPYPDIFSRGLVIVTLQMDSVIDTDLDFFGTGQSILFGLHLRPPIERPDRRNHIPPIVDGDVEIQLEPTLGVGGTIVCRGLTVSWRKDRLARAAVTPLPRRDIFRGE